MGAPRKKKFVAVCDFQVGRDKYAKGDEVPNPSAALQAVLNYGDRFVVAVNTRRDAANKESEADQ